MSLRGEGSRNIRSVEIEEERTEDSVLGDAIPHIYELAEGVI